jgi:hypothetical protein
MTQSILTRIIKLMFAILICAFAYILFSGASQPDMQSSLVDGAAILELQEFEDIAPGETTLRRVNGTPTWITRVDAKLLEQMQTVSAAVTGQACAIELGLCLLDAKTSVDGILFSRTETAPPQLASPIEWYGGFVDPTNGAVFDRLGRVYVLNGGSQATPMRSLDF